MAKMEGNKKPKTFVGQLPDERKRKKENLFDEVKI